MSDDLFTNNRLTERAIEQIGFARDWLNRIERDVMADKCINAQLLLDLADATVKLNYTAGMINSIRLRQYATDGTAQPESDRR